MEANYDIGLVILSVVMATFVSFTALGLVSHIPRVDKADVWRWITGGAISMGSGVWTMHFIGMLAFHLPIPVAYDPGITGLSILFAIGGSAVALWVVHDGIDSKLKLHSSATLLALAICAMHYTGMAAMRMLPGIVYSPTLVFASFLVAYGASLFALTVTFSSSAASLPILFSHRNIAGALLMGGAVAGMHYIGMAAASFSNGSICQAVPGGLAGAELAIVVAVLALFVLVLTLLALRFDLRFAEQQMQNMELLKQQNLALEDKASRLADEMVRQIRETAQQDRLLATIVEQARDALITTDTQGKITSWNWAAEQLFGYQSDEAVGSRLSRFITETIDGETNPDPDRGYTTLHNRNGDKILATAGITPLCNEENMLTGHIYTFRDITAEKYSREQMLLWSKVFEHSGQAIMITDTQNRLVSVNQAFVDILGYTPKEVIGRNPNMLSSGKHDTAFYQAMWRDVLEKGFWQGEIWNRHKDGHLVPEWLHITTTKNKKGKITNHIAIFTDATAYKEKEAHIEHLAQHDMLTGLPNRVLLEDRLSQAIAHADRRDDLVAVMFIDLDRFKLINDTLGHHVGDKLLQEVGIRLTMAVRDEDTVSRQGGDEFIVVLRELKTAKDAMVIAENLVAELSTEYRIEGHTLRVTPSIGISLYPLDANDAETLVRNADAAMYHAKEMGRANFQFFTNDLNQALSERLQLEQELRAAVDKQQFSLHFQPQVRLSDGLTTGVEVLLRWFHPQRGAIGPDRFIPLAEDINLIQPLGNWVLEQAVTRLAQWRDTPLQSLQMSVNVSARQLEAPGFCAFVESLLDRHSIDPSRLKLEITETALMRDIELSARHLALLHQLRLRISVDDFGTGYSSLAYLKNLPIDELKIDREFIRNVDHNAYDEAISRAIIALANTLNLQRVAEGVETEKQRRFLQIAGCRHAQGYLFARPMPYEELLEYLQYSPPSGQALPNITNG